MYPGFYPPPHEAMDLPALIMAGLPVAGKAISREGPLNEKLLGA
jgi:hypothetical protein